MLQLREQARRLVLAQEQLQLRKSLPQFGHGAWHDERADGRDHAQAQGTGHGLPRRRRDVGDVFRPFEQRAPSFGNFKPERCRQHRALGAFKQRRAEQVLEFLDRRTQRRLADKACLGRLAEMPPVNDGNEIAQLAQGGDELHAPLIIEKSD